MRCLSFDGRTTALTPSLLAMLLLAVIAEQAAAGDQKNQLESIVSWLAPRTVFVTPMDYTGYLGGLAGADEICNEHAKGVDSIVPDGEYIAILSSANESAASRVGVSMGPIINSLGEPVAENVTALFSGIKRRYRSTPNVEFEVQYTWNEYENPLSSPINRTATGELAPPAAETWTGSQPNGQPVSMDPTELCSGWTTANAEKIGRAIGLPQSRSAVGWITGEEYIATIKFGCDRLRGLYCLQKY